MNRASTDMGNVSQIVDAIHPYIGVGGEASNHQAAFAESCVGDRAERTLIDGATALAWTAADVGAPASRHRTARTQARGPSRSNGTTIPKGDSDMSGDTAGRHEGLPIRRGCARA
jgi:hypothetical protein